MPSELIIVNFRNFLFHKTCLSSIYAIIVRSVWVIVVNVIFKTISVSTELKLHNKTTCACMYV